MGYTTCICSNIEKHYATKKKISNKNSFEFENEIELSQCDVSLEAKLYHFGIIISVFCFLISSLCGFE